MGGSDPFHLEQRFEEIKDKGEVTVLAEVLIRCPGYNVCRTAIHKQQFVTDVALDPGRPTFSFLRGMIVKGGRLPLITSSHVSHVIQHAETELANLNKVIEVCAGIGAVSTCLKFCNAQASCYVDSNPKFAEWLDRKDGAPVVHGDIADVSTIQQVAEITQGIPSPLNGGVACQPFSALGDQREHEDPRSNSLPALLRMGYLLRSPLITIECTKEARESHWVQSMLRSFAEQTGYHLHQNVLTLHNTWPAYRTRWWACLSMPMLGITEIPDMPQMDFVPSIMHLLQIHAHLPPEEAKQLNLSAYELRHFHDQPKGISASIINAAKAMPTATHSWGSQLVACHCGCRQQGFTMARIHSKGLYGVLIPLGTMVKAGQDWYHGMRHPHPKEVALLNALDPRYLDNSSPFTLKFLLAGVGQLASPLQGAWMFSNLFFQMMKNGFPVSVHPPRHVMANICRELLVARDETWPHFVQTRSTVLFEREMMKLDHPLTTLHQDNIDEFVHQQLHPSQVPLTDTPNPGQGENRLVTEDSTCESSFIRELSHAGPVHDVEADMPSSSELLAVLEPVVIIQDFPVEPPFQVSALLSVSALPHECEDPTPCLMKESITVTAEQPAQVTPKVCISNEVDDRSASASEAGSVCSAEHPSRVGPSDHTSQIHCIRSEVGVGPIASEAGKFASVEGFAANLAEVPFAQKLIQAHGIELDSVVSAQSTSMIAHDPAHVHANVHSHHDSCVSSQPTVMPNVSNFAADPSLPDAKPVPRLGCAGPAPMSGARTEMVTECQDQATSDFSVHGSIALAAETSPAYVHANVHGHHDSSVSSQPTVKPNVSNLAAAPSLPDAKPVPRLGCAGPAPMSVARNELVKECQDQAASDFSKKGPIADAMHAQVPGIDVPQHETMTTKPDPLILNDPWAAACKFPHGFGEDVGPGKRPPNGSSNLLLPVAPSAKRTAIQKHQSNGTEIPVGCPSLPDAMPVPRLGCAGPASMINADTEMMHPKMLGPLILQHDRSQPAVAAMKPDNAHVTTQGIHDLSVQRGNAVMSIQPDRHAVPSLPDAMPVPRLGCAGPAPMIASGDETVPACLNPQGRSPEQECVPTSTHQDQDQTSVTTNTVPCSQVLPSLPDAMPVPRLGCAGPSPTVSTTNEQLHDHPDVPSGTAVPTANAGDALTVWVGHSTCPLHAVHATKGETVGQLATAESKLRSMPFPVRTLTAMGSHLPVYHKLSHNQIVLIEDGAKDHQAMYPEVSGLNRQDALWCQQGWVATDEMAFYLTMLGQPNLANTTAPLIMQGNPDDALRFDRWIGEVLDSLPQNTNPTTIHTVCLLDQHWFPISIRTQDDEIHLTTTFDALPVVRAWAVAALGEIFHFHYKMPQAAFPADCGFQALAWIMAQELGASQAYPMPVEEAIKWRELFASHLIHYNLMHGDTHGLQFGGMLEPHLTELSSLLQRHGVKTERAPTLVQQLVQTIGMASIKQTMGSAHPWADLKSKASALQPPIKLVHADELQAQIADRLRNGKSFGGRKNKKPKQVTQAKWVAPHASQVQIPDGIFQQQDGVPLAQITLHQMQTGQRGIAVLNLEDAKPFFGLQKPLCSEGLGLVVLEFQADILPPNHQQIRFPASCPETQEPMILTAALIQLGHQPVARVMPTQPTSVDQIDTAVLRVVLYKDQSTIPWKSMQVKPVKTIMDLEHFQQLSKEDLLDVWDRQHLSKQYQKMKPDESDLFSFVMRIRASCVDRLMKLNSKDGLYFEPRTQSGRAPCPEHRVVWLPRQGFHDVVIAKQSTSQATCIARSGDRYGLRTSVQDAETVHAQHRPEVAYLDGAATKMFRIAPMPFGSTKQSLQKVFEAWEWGARPSHTQGLTPDRQGLVWIAHATEQPNFYIYTMEHGDVLISEVQTHKPAPQPMNGAPVASARTLRCLTVTSASASAPDDDKGMIDPLQANDPWASAYKGHTAKHVNPSAGQLAAIETNVEKRVLAVLHEQNALPKTEDANMDPQIDHRMAQLETQVHQLTDNLNQLSGSMTSFKQQQQTHNTQVAHQVQALKTQADQQEHAMKSILDQKMEEQMARIEALLTNKRTKTAAE
eukprot:s1703_g5.t1